MEERVYDLNNGGKFCPLPVHGSHRTNLKNAILKTLRAVPGSGLQIMSTYNPDPVHWQIPPIYAGKLKSTQLQVSVPTFKCRADRMLEDFVKLVFKFIDEGWSKSFERQLQFRLGDMCTHPEVFDRKNTNAARFAVEYVIAISRAFKNGLVVMPGMCALALNTNVGIEYIGIVANKVVGAEIEVSQDDLFSWLYFPRATVITKRYSVLDRIKYWIDNNYERIENADGLSHALALVKLSQTENCGEEDAEFEQEIRAIANNQPALKATFDPSLKMTYEDFSKIRETWVSGDQDTYEEALLDLFGALVPSVFDSQMFVEVFGHMPSENRLTAKDITRINKGMARLPLEYIKLID